MRWLFCFTANLPKELIFTVSPSIKQSEISSNTVSKSSAQSLRVRPISCCKLTAMLALVIVFVVTACPVVVGEAVTTVPQDEDGAIALTALLSRREVPDISYFHIAMFPRFPSTLAE